MKKTSNLTVLIVFGFVFLAFFYAFVKIYVMKNFYVDIEIACDPTVESCYEYVCDPEYEECTGDPIEDTWHYKIVQKKATFMSSCDPEVDDCAEADCSGLGESLCQIINCSVEDGEECVTPENYAPPEEEDEAVEDCDVKEDCVEEDCVEESEEGEMAV